MTCAKTLAFLTSAITKATCVAWVVLAGFALKEILQEFSKEGYSVEGNTLYIPYEVCTPHAIPINGSDIIFDNAIPTCGVITYFFNAVMLSLIISIATVVAYLFFCVLSTQKERCALDSRVIYGMGVFLCFPLVQTALLMWMVYTLGETFIEDLASELDNLTANYGMTQVKHYGNINILLATGGLGLSLSLFLLVDALEAIFCSVRKKNWAGPPPDECANNKRRVSLEDHSASSKDGSNHSRTQDSTSTPGKSANEMGKSSKLDKSSTHSKLDRSSTHSRTSSTTTKAKNGSKTTKIDKGSMNGKTSSSGHSRSAASTAPTDDGSP